MLQSVAYAAVIRNGYSKLELPPCAPARSHTSAANRWRRSGRRRQQTRYRRSDGSVWKSAQRCWSRAAKLAATKAR